MRPVEMEDEWEVNETRVVGYGPVKSPDDEEPEAILSREYLREVLELMDELDMVVTDVYTVPHPDLDTNCLAFTRHNEKDWAIMIAGRRSL